MKSHADSQDIEGEIVLHHIAFQVDRSEHSRPELQTKCDPTERRAQSALFVYKHLRAFVQRKGKRHVFNADINHNCVMKYRTTNLCTCTTATAAISNRCGHAIADMNVWSSETRGPWRYAANNPIPVMVCTKIGVFPTNLCCSRKHMQCSMHAYWR